MNQGDSAAFGVHSPLSESRPSNLNINLTTFQNSPHKEAKIGASNNYDNMENQSPPSSPFNADVTVPLPHEDAENNTITKSQITAKSPIDREQTSPLKMLKSRATAPKDGDIIRSPRKISAPERRFPIKPASPEPNRPAPVEVSIDDVLRDNEGLTKAIQILEDEDSVNEGPTLDDTLMSTRGGMDVDETMGPDDTFVSTFSTFSAVPDMTTFARVGQTPSRLAPTPRRTVIETPATQRRPAGRPSPTPRAHTYNPSRDNGNDTNLLDFTDQMNGFNGYAQPSPSRTGRHSPFKSVSDMPWATTPTVNRNTMSNLLDFDIPPAPTPRSMPSVTPRELESLKSQFLSEISSLKASLSGKEAEVQSLKTAVGDAEKRVGESMEQVREERNHREQLVVEKEDWEKRGREMEAVLRNVKEEIVHGERERDELEGRLEESEGRRQAAEFMAQETERKLASMRAGKSSLSESTDSSRTSPPTGECVDCGGTKAVEIAVEKVSRELHALYKEKHETKVAALKKSYEKRWEKKIRELEEQIMELQHENEDLKRDLTMTRLEPRNPIEPTIDVEQIALAEARSKELEAEIDGLNESINTIQNDNSDLRRLLETERVENSKLVQAVDEMIPLVAAFDDMLAKDLKTPEPTPAPPTPSRSIPRSPGSRPMSVSSVSDLKGSFSRASGLKAPTNLKSRIAGPSALGHDRTKSVQRSGIERTGLERTGLERPGSGLGYTGRSGIMNSIEKMGSYRGRGD